jgi:hypothetical protein
MAPRIGAALLVLLSLLAPTMACALPGSQMTAAEHACCRQMKGECGSMKMPASHSCCQKTAQVSQMGAVPQPESGTKSPAISIAAVVPESPVLETPTLVYHPLAKPNDSPPGYAVPTFSVLRI